MLLVATAGLLLWRKAGEESTETARGPQSFAEQVAPWMLLVLVLFAGLVSASRDWTHGSAFGQRRMVDWSMFFAVGMGFFLQRSGGWGFGLGTAGLAVLAALVNGALIVVYLLKLLPEYGMVI